MADVNPSPIRPPRKWLDDPEISKDIQDLYFFLYQLLQRTGGGVDLIEGNAEDIITNTTNIAVNANNIAVNVVDIALNKTNIATNVVDIDTASNGWVDTQSSTDDFQGAYLESVQRSDYVTIGNEIIKLVNNTIVTLNLTPSDKERVYVKSTGKGFTVQSNKLIDGKDCIRINKPFAGRWFSYSLELNTWSIL